MVLDRLRSLLPASIAGDVPVVPVVRLVGPIGLPPSAFRQSLSLTGVAGALRRAFSNKRARAVAITINSPGGSAVQSNLIYKRIRQLADENDKKVHVFVEDVAASGGYFIACAGDEIVADPSSIVGSIGVVTANFGLDRAIERLGIDRRVHTAGDKKVTFDPFQPEKPEDVRRLKAVLKDMHATFIDVVKESRADRLDGTDKQLFSGEFWTAKKGLELGLVDKLGDLRSVLREAYGEKVLLPIVPTQRRGLFGMTRGAAGGSLGAGTGIAAAAAAGLLEQIEERALWARYGL